MHPEARDYVARFGTDDKVSVVEIGSRDINGTPRDLFPNARYIGIDVVDGKGVDKVADGAVWAPRTKVDVVVCCETLEHTADWRDIIQNVAGMLKTGGLFLITAAGLGRIPHSAVDGGVIRPDEFYENIDPDVLAGVLTEAGFVDIDIDVLGPDVRASCRK